MADAVKPMGNPAVVGLAGFGITTTLLQFHNMGWGGTGTVFCAAMVIGGLMQLMAGFQEFKVGNNFGYSAFCAYGAFWMALGLIWLLADAVPKEGWGHLKITGFDIGLFLLGYTIYTLFMFFAAIRIHTAMALTFTTLIIGFVGLDLVFLAGMKNLLLPTTIDLFGCAFMAFYMMAAAIYAQVYGRPILPVGKPWVN